MNLAHSASFHSREKTAPSKPGIKQCHQQHIAVADHLPIYLSHIRLLCHASIVVELSKKSMEMQIASTDFADPGLQAALALHVVIPSYYFGELWGEIMFEVTWPDGRKAQVDGTSVVRIRRSVRGEGGATRIDLTSARYQLVTETPEAIAQMTKAELPSLVSIRSVDATSVWFNAKGVTGPVPITPFDREGTDIKSALLIFPPKKQFTLETAAQVADIIRAGGGTPAPLPPEDGVMAAMKHWFGTVFGSKTLQAPDEDDGPPGAMLEQ